MELINCNSEKIVWYRVQNKDDKKILLKKFNVNDGDIIRNNASLELYEGEIIIIEKKEGKYHIVKPMETLSIIAKMYNIDVDTLVRINSLNSKRIFIGQKLKISTDN